MEDVPESSAESDAEDVPESSAESVAEDVPESSAESDAEDVLESSAESDAEDVPESSAASDAEDVPELSAESDAEDDPESRRVGADATAGGRPEECDGGAATETAAVSVGPVATRGRFALCDTIGAEELDEDLESVEE